MKQYKGFTLIELMIAVAIVAILAAVALPSYQNSVQKSRRVIAQNALLDAAALQEKAYLQNNQYNGDIGMLINGTSASTVVPGDGFYDITVLTNAVTCPAGAGTCYQITATATGSQLDDTDCRTLVINNLGQKTATNSSGSNNNDECW